MAMKEIRIDYNEHRLNALKTALENSGDGFTESIMMAIDNLYEKVVPESVKKEVMEQVAKDSIELVKAIKKLDEDKARQILKKRFTVFKESLIKLSENEKGASYIVAQIEQQLSGFCKQMSLFEDN